MGTCPSRFNPVHCLTPCFIIIIFLFTKKTEILYVFLVYSMRILVISRFHANNIWWRLQITVNLLGPKYSPELHDININKKRNLSRTQGRNVNYCGGMFRIQNFPLYVLGSTRSIRMLRISEENLTQPKPNIQASTMHRDFNTAHPHKIFHQTDACWYYSSTSTSEFIFRWLRHKYCTWFSIFRHLVAALDHRHFSKRISSLCNVLVSRLFYP